MARSTSSPEKPSFRDPAVRRHATRKLFSLKGAMLGAVAFVYLLSPVDFAPEVVLGPLGLVDDAGVVLAMLRWLKSGFAHRYDPWGSG